MEGWGWQREGKRQREWIQEMRTKEEKNEVKNCREEPSQSADTLNQEDFTLHQFMSWCMLVCIYQHDCHELGPQGFFLLKESFPCPCCSFRGQALGLLSAWRHFLIVTDINKVDLNYCYCYINLDWRAIIFSKKKTRKYPLCHRLIFRSNYSL